jgi:rod shape-determining protein MreD
MRVLGFAALALALLAVESVLVKHLGLEVTRIDVGLALVVYVGLRATPLQGAFTAFAVGYLLDVFSGRPTGLYPFLSMLAYLLVRAAALVVDGRSRGMFALLTAAATLGHALLAVFFSWLTSPSGGVGAWSLWGLPVQMVLTALAGLALWPVLTRLEPGDRPEPGVVLR